jgi:hypothetical protein
MNPNVPEVTPPREAEFGGESLAEVSVCGGGLTLWGTCDTVGEPSRQVKLRLDPAKPVVIGRQQGGRIPYMDEKYRSTEIGPSGKSVLTSCGQGIDTSVSRGHFMLRGSPLGILFVNGVPRPDGGIRAPLNGTLLVWPGPCRWLEGGEEYVIEHGQGSGGSNSSRNRLWKVE